MSEFGETLRAAIALAIAEGSDTIEVRHLLAAAGGAERPDGPRPDDHPLPMSDAAEDVLQRATAAAMGTGTGILNRHILEAGATQRSD